MKKGISYWSFNGGLEGKADIEAVLREAQALGFESVELTVPGGALNFESSEKTCRAIAQMARTIGLEISSLASGVYWRTSLSAGSAGTRKLAIEYTRKMLQIARWLGTDALLVVPGAVDVFFDPASEHVRYDECYQLARRSIRACVKTAEKLKVALCLENVWNKFLLSPLEYRDFIDGFKSKYVRAYFDCGNARLNGFPEHWIELLGKKRLGRVHCKGFKSAFFGGGERGETAEIAAKCRAIAPGSGWAGAYSFCRLTGGDLDWKAIMAAFKKVGYDGYLIAEMLPFRAGQLRETKQDLDAIFKM